MMILLLQLQKENNNVLMIFLVNIHLAQQNYMEKGEVLDQKNVTMNMMKYSITKHLC